MYRACGSQCASRRCLTKRGKFKNISEIVGIYKCPEIGGKFINFVEIRGIFDMHNWLRGMDASVPGQFFEK